MTEVSFRVNSVPVAQPRQRHRIATAGDGRTWVHNYTPVRDPVNAYKAAVGKAVADAYRGAPLDGPLRVELTFVLPRPSSLRWKRRPMPRRPHQSKPDAENLAKSTLDACTAAGLWRDDAQVAELVCVKLIAAGDEAPHVEVLCRTLDVPVQAPVPEAAPLFPEDA